MDIPLKQPCLALRSFNLMTARQSSLGPIFFLTITMDRQENVQKEGKDQAEDIVASRELNLKYEENGKLVSNNVQAKVLRGQDLAYAAVAFTFAYKLDHNQVIASLLSRYDHIYMADPGV